CKIFVDATQAEEVAGASVLHLGIKQCRRRKLERLADCPQRGADDLITAESGAVEAVVRMLQQPRLQRIKLLQCHGNQIDITPREGAIGERLVVTPLSVGALSKADEVQQRAVDVVFVARSIWRRAVRLGHGHGRYPWLDDAGGSGDASLDQHFEEARIIA